MNPYYIEPLDLTLRLLLSLVLGGMIGYERERNNRPAGFRTHILVCVGSTLLMLISAYAFGDFATEPSVRLDPTRLAAQVIPSIGFLGAGTILRNGFSVTGLTTAASLWVASAIGLAVGAGFYYGALLATAIVLASLYILNKIEKKFFTGLKVYTFVIRAVNKPGVLSSISTMLSSESIAPDKLSVQEEFIKDVPNIRITFSSKLPRKTQIVDLVERMQLLDDVISVSFEIK